MMVHTWRKDPPWLVQRLWWYCTTAKKRCKCTWAEKSESAGSYRGEILGGIMTQLILRAAATGYKGKIPRVGADCDNMGVVTHGNTPHIPLSANPTQADLLRVFKNLVSIQSFTVKYKFVRSHEDNSKKWQDCTLTLKEQINIRVDTFAKKAIKAAHCTKEFIEYLSKWGGMDRNGWQEDNRITKVRTWRILGASYGEEVFPRKEDSSGGTFWFNLVARIRKGNGRISKNILHVCNKASIWMVPLQL